MKGNPERVAVFIDGSNLYHKLRTPELDFKNLSKFDYRGMAKWLARERQLVQCSYYVGVVRAIAADTKGQAMRIQQQRLFAHLHSPTQQFIVQRGHLMKTDGSYHEKGVDVQLALDLAIGAFENTFDVAILISSDTDLIPAVKKVIQKGKKLEYVGFSHQPSFGLQKHATSSRLLIKEELLPFVAL